MEGQHIFVATNQVRSRNDPKSDVRLYPYGLLYGFEFTVFQFLVQPG